MVKINKDAQLLGKRGGRPKTETAKHTFFSNAKPLSINRINMENR